jgi:hypothetical protein
MQHMASGPLIDDGRPLKVPQFHLRTLLAVIAILAVLFSVMGTIGPMASAGLLLILTVVGLHVAGNALGTSLRDGAPQRVADCPANDRPEHRPASVHAGLPVSRLHEHTPPGWIIRATTLIGAGIGAWLGIIVFAEWTDGTGAGLVVGAVSLAVLGGFFGFLLGSFLKMSLLAWWQATRSSDSVSRQ